MKKKENSKFNYSTNTLPQVCLSPMAPVWDNVKILNCKGSFKKKNNQTYGNFHMLVDPPPPTNGKSQLFF